MYTAQVPAIDMNKLNFFIVQFVTDLDAAVRTGMVDVVAKAGFKRLRRCYGSSLQHCLGGSLVI